MEPRVQVCFDAGPDTRVFDYNLPFSREVTFSWFINLYGSFLIVDGILGDSNSLNIVFASF